ncbi:unnamed protein product [Pneumocystis jirovecii]|uniref:RRM domain-containing protein n=1 Tax=Pneumocystis jirovecii TaxID=42068 RepID=L0P8Y3_PNEJI|nr:unnamed protein product [Pneumocystis jirovecii]CCJ28833.1 unnamed protein product [Pneumocystis jirovecii]
MSVTDTSYISVSLDAEPSLISAMTSLSVTGTNNVTVLTSKESIFDDAYKHINTPLTPVSNEASPAKQLNLLSLQRSNNNTNLPSPPSSSPLLSVQDQKQPTSNSSSVKQKPTQDIMSTNAQLEFTPIVGYQYNNNNILYNTRGKYIRNTNLNATSKCPADRQHTYTINSFLRNHPTHIRPTWFTPHNPHPSSLYHSIPAANMIPNPIINTNAFTATSGAYRYPGHVHTSMSSIYSSSPQLPSTPLSPQIAGMIAAGPPVPAPVPSIFPGPTYYDTLESSLQNPNKTTNVYIRGLPPDTTDESLYILASRFGKIHSSKAILDTQSGTCKGFGFACFEQEEEAKACIAGLMHFELHHKA